MQDECKIGLRGGEKRKMSSTNTQTKSTEKLKLLLVEKDKTIAELELELRNKSCNKCSLRFERFPDLKYVCPQCGKLIYEEAYDIHECHVCGYKQKRILPTIEEKLKELAELKSRRDLPE